MWQLQFFNSASSRQVLYKVILWFMTVKTGRALYFGSEQLSRCLSATSNRLSFDVSHLRFFVQFQTFPKRKIFTGSFVLISNRSTESRRLWRKSITCTEGKSEKKSFLIDRNCVCVMLMYYERGEKDLWDFVLRELDCIKHLVKLKTKLMPNLLQDSPVQQAWWMWNLRMNYEQCKDSSVEESIWRDSHSDRDACDDKARGFRFFLAWLCWIIVKFISLNKFLKV